MKAIKNKQTGRLKVKVSKPIIGGMGVPDNDEKAKRQFGQNLQSSKIGKDSKLKQVSERQWKIED